MALHIHDYGLAVRNSFKKDLREVLTMAMCGASIMPFMMVNMVLALPSPRRYNEKLEQLDDNLWQCKGYLWRPISLDIRMTVVRFPDGKLLIHSPLAPEKHTVEEICSLGELAYLLAPSMLHDMYSSEWKALFPNAQILCARQCEQLLSHSMIVDAHAEDVLPGLGIKMHDHADVLLHSHVSFEVPMTGNRCALLFSDQFQNHSDPAWGRVPGIGGGVRVTRLFRVAGTRDEVGFCRQMMDLSELNGLTHLLFCHGPPITTESPDDMKVLMGNAVRNSFPHMKAVEQTKSS